MKTKALTFLLNGNLFLLILIMLVFPTYSYSQDEKLEVLGTSLGLHYFLAIFK